MGCHARGRRVRPANSTAPIYDIPLARAIPTAGGVAVLGQAEDPVVVVQGQHDHRPGVLDHQAVEGRLVTGVRAPHQVLPHRHHPVVAVQVGALDDGPRLGAVTERTGHHTGLDMTRT